MMRLVQIRYNLLLKGKALCDRIIVKLSTQKEPLETACQRSAILSHNTAGWPVPFLAAFTPQPYALYPIQCWGKQIDDKTNVIDSTANPGLSEQLTFSNHSANCPRIQSFDTYNSFNLLGAVDILNVLSHDTNGVYWEDGQMKLNDLSSNDSNDIF